MNKEINNLKTKTDNLKRTISRVRTDQVRTQRVIDKAKEFVYDYFKLVRPRLVEIYGLPERAITPLDDEIQNLFRLTQRASLKKKYKEALNRIKEEINNLEEFDLTISPSSLKIEAKDRQILNTLQGISPAAATAYEQGLRDLRDENHISWRGTAAEFREVLREVLDALAPDSEVMSSERFKLEQGLPRPTMKQKVVFILKERPQRIADPIPIAVELVDELTGKFVRSVYTSASTTTHTFSERDEILKIKDYLSTALANLLEI